MPIAKFFVSNSKDKKLRKNFKNITGLDPRNVSLYKLAIRHSSQSKSKIENSNERLEFLGDAILGSIVAEYLFKKFPFKDEGFLTEIRSRIVNRESLNSIAKKVGLNKLVTLGQRKRTPHSHKSLYGNALEALVGAVYLDKGYKKCTRFVIKKLIIPHVDIEDVVNQNKNYKSLLIEWGQKTNKKIEFKIIKESGHNHSKEFTAQVIIEGTHYQTGKGMSKKKAELFAAEKTFEELNLNDNSE